MYDRQIRLWGLEAQQRCASVRVPCPVAPGITRDAVVRDCSRRSVSGLWKSESEMGPRICGPPLAPPRRS